MEDIQSDIAVRKKSFYEVIFVILVFKNTDDVENLLESINSKVKDCKIIIVNSFYDDSSKKIFRKIAQENSCIFLNITNKGYGYGNNAGIRYALERYSFNSLIVANPDTIIEKFYLSSNDVDIPILIGPKIKTSRGKNQNPLWVIENKFSEWLMFIGHKYRKQQIVFMGIIINKLIREAFILLLSFSKIRNVRVYAVHGSFLILTKSLLDRTGAPFDENMFLFSEEMFLAKLLKSRGISTVLTSDIIITHKEDGSMGQSSIDISDENRKSYLYYYSIRKQLKSDCDS